MHFIPEPTIQVIGRLRLDWDAIEGYLDEHDRDWEIDIPPDGTRDLELASEFAGRVCFDAFGKAQYRRSNEYYLGNILEQRHGSVLEHASVMLLIRGVSRTLTHELIRHRVGVAYSQRSQRYVNEGEAGFVIPPELAALWNEDRNEDEQAAVVQWYEAMGVAAEAYKNLSMLLQKRMNTEEALKPRERRIRSKQAARSVLPNATETTLVMTANMRSLRHICEVRGGMGAEAEIRRFACALLRLMKEEAPNIFADMEVAELEDGIEGVTIQHSKV